MSSLKFQLLDQRQNQQTEVVRSAFEEAGLVEAELDLCDVLVVHERTDAPESDPYGLTWNHVDRILQEGGIYIEYTTGPTNWEKRAERHYYGNHTELSELLSVLSPPVSIDDLDSVLQQAAVRVENLVVLCILCQSYLAAHGGIGLTAWENIPEELKGRVESFEKQELVSRLSWWQSALSDNSDWKTRIKQEANEQARRKSLPEEAEKVESFVESLEEHGGFSKLVEPTYCAIRRLLGEA